MTSVEHVLSGAFLIMGSNRYLRVSRATSIVKRYSTPGVIAKGVSERFGGAGRRRPRA
jgi:hypothetical protein